MAEPVLMAEPVESADQDVAAAAERREEVEWRHAAKVMGHMEALVELGRQGATLPEEIKGVLSSLGLFDADSDRE